MKKHCVLVSLMAMLSGCTETSPPETSSTLGTSSLPTEGAPQPLQAVADDLAEPEQPVDVIYAGSVVDGQPVSSVSTLSPERFSIDVPSERKADAVPAPPRTSKLAPDLALLVAQGIPSEKTSVLVLFRETIKIPRFPSFHEEYERDAPENAEARARTQEIISRINEARQPEHARRAEELSTLGAQVKESFWLINAQSLELPLSSIKALSDRPDVVSVDLVKSGTIGTNQLVDSRGLMATDYFYSFNAGFIGSIDSGVRSTHVLLSNPTRLSWVRDCVNGTSNNCGTGTNLDPTDQANHGTGVISILSGNSNQTNSNRGLTGIYVDSFRATDNVGGIYGDAFIRAYSAAVAGGDKVITTSLQRWEDQDSTIAAAAEGAFNAGSVVVALQGNQGPSTYQTRCPANARRVLAVGAIDVSTQTIESYSSRGPSNDNRIKPDLVAPTNVRAASSQSDTAYYNIFNGTSAATPHAAGAAALWRNWLTQGGTTIEPGQVYAHLLASGDRVAFDNTYGAGLLVLPTNTVWFAGKTSMSSGTVVDMPINITGTVSRIDAAIWWPESSGQHNDIDLKLLDPSGNAIATSTSSASVFEKLRVNVTATGTYKVRIQWYSGSGTQPVYWTALKRD